MRKRTAVSLIAVVTASLGWAGCGGSEAEPAKAPASEAPRAASAPKAVTYAYLPVAPYKVQLEAPANAKVHESGDHYMVWSDDFAACSAIVNNIPPGLAEMEGYDSAVKQAQMSTMGGSIKSWTKQEKRKDGGYALEWTYTGGIEKKDAWGLAYRTILDGKYIDCGSNGLPSAEVAACVARMCSTLKAL